jgi:hypothetical protein
MSECGLVGASKGWQWTTPPQSPLTLLPNPVTAANPERHDLTFAGQANLELLSAILSFPSNGKTI